MPGTFSRSSGITCLPAICFKQGGEGRKIQACTLQFDEEEKEKEYREGEMGGRIGNAALCI